MQRIFTVYIIMRMLPFTLLCILLLTGCALGYDDNNNALGGRQNGMEVIEQKVPTVMPCVTDAKPDLPKPGGLDHSSMSGSFAINTSGVRVGMDGTVKGPLNALYIGIVAIIAVAFVAVCITLGYFKHQTARVRQHESTAQPRIREETKVFMESDV